MKKKIVGISMLVLLLLGTTFKVFATNNTEELFGINLRIGETFVIQGVPKIQETVNSDKTSKNSATYLFSIKLTKEFENGQIVARFKGGRGLGIEGQLDKNGQEKKLFLTYAQTNGTADSTLDGSANTLAKITELFYQHSFLNKRLTVNFGKLGFGSYFAENKYAKNKTTQFITGTFSTDKTIDTPPERLALRLKYIVNNKFDISYGYFITNVNEIYKKGVNIIEFAYKPSKKCNCLTYIWENNNTYYSYENNSKSHMHGFGISVDQEIHPNFGIFARFGYKDPSIGQKKTEDSIFILPLSMAWSTGTELKGSSWRRSDDTIGFAVGQIFGSRYYKKYKNIGDDKDKNYKDNAETEAELYYRISLDKYISITPAFQYIINPRGGNSPSKDNIFIFGIRTQVDF
ncbi:MAG: carbohydrate porin [Endomicrobium sp.]|jgi:hypothetical protein|nr:carbohydrate porin [Endomicrobium sp.]